MMVSFTILYNTPTSSSTIPHGPLSQLYAEKLSMLTSKSWEWERGYNTQLPLKPITTTTTTSLMITDTADPSLPLSLAFGLIFLAIIITITVAVSVAVYWRARKAKSAASFYLQQNEAYHGIITLQCSSSAEGEGTISTYSYPVVDGDKTKSSNPDIGSKIIITEQNEAYGSRTTHYEEVLETNNYYTQVITDYETGKHENHCQQAKPMSDKWQWNQDNLEYNKAYNVVSSQNNVYESLNAVSSTGPTDDYY